MQISTIGILEGQAIHLVPMEELNKLSAAALPAYSQQDMIRLLRYNEPGLLLYLQGLTL